jgi:hypothetical protein
LGPGPGRVGGIPELGLTTKIRAVGRALDFDQDMPRIKTGPSTVTALRKPVHYHMLFRPFLQRRFARASLWTFVVCCVVSFLIGDRYGNTRFIRVADMVTALNLLFPWTMTFPRGFGLFATVFPILVIRKGDLHGRPIF